MEDSVDVVRDWQAHPVQKNVDGTYIIMDGKSPYQVCDRAVDPSGRYDINEVAAFWASLVPNDPRRLEEMGE